jgi:hypothetical protein
MYFVIFDSSGNMVESFDDEGEAREALDRIVHEDPEAADHYAILTFDVAGDPVGEAITVADAGITV